MFAKGDMQKKKLRNYFIAAGITVAFFIVHLFLGSISFDSNDDEYLNLIAGGVFGNHSEYLIYVNVVYGQFLKFLYQTFPGHNWYIYLKLIFNFLSIFLICRVITENKQIYEAIFCAIIANLLLSYEFYNVLQFTKESYLYTAVGSLLIWDYASNNIRRSSIEGVLFLFLGFLMRNSGFYAGLAFIIPIILLFLILYNNEKKKLIIRLAMCGLSAVLVCTVAYAINQYAYSSDEWQKYLKYNSVRSDMTDFGLINYEGNEDIIRTAGYSKSDYQMLKNWNFGDEEYFTLERLESLNNISPKSARGINTHMIQEGLKTISKDISNHLSAMITLSMIVFSLILLKGNKKIVPVAMIILIVLFYFVMLAFYGRILWRTDCAGWIICGILICEYLSQTFNFENKNKTIRFFAFLSIICMTFDFGYYTNHFSEVKRSFFDSKDSYATFFYETSKYQENVYIGDTFTFVGKPYAPNAFSLGEEYKQYYSNYLPMGGWYVPSPLWKEHAEKLRIDNPIKDLLKENVYLADNWTSDLVLDYIHDHYDSDASMTQVTTIDGIKIWKIDP